MPIEATLKSGFIDAAKLDEIVDPEKMFNSYLHSGRIYNQLKFLNNPGKDHRITLPNPDMIMKHQT